VFATFKYEQAVRAVVNEHSRALMWGARQAQIIPAGLPWLTQETGIDLRSAFAGDDRLTLVSAEPVYLTRQRGLAVQARGTRRALAYSRRRRRSCSRGGRLSGRVVPTPAR